MKKEQQTLKETLTHLCKDCRYSTNDLNQFLIHEEEH